MDASATVSNPRQDYKILGLISTGHFMSHFYFLVLPPLFPFLREEFDVSYTQLGVLMTVIYGSSAITQIPVGVMVDRWGARVVLTFGLIMMSVGFGLMGLVHSFWPLAILGIVAATGNSVFHPADYAILNSSINEKRMGRAFSIHTFAGHIGSAVAPASIILISGWYGWRVALVASGVFGLLVMLVMTTQWSSLHDDALPKKKKKDDAAATSGKAPNSWSVLFSGPMIIFFLFFAALSMATSGMQSFVVSALVDLHGISLEVASMALTVFLFCSAVGILIGGEISDRTERHDLVAAASFIIFAVASVLMAWFNLPAAILFGLMTLNGLGNGIIRPARDMMVRAASPKGKTGSVFGFVSAGISAGAALAPIPFGYMLDIGKPEWVFYLLAIFMMIALFTVAIPKKIE